MSIIGNVLGSVATNVIGGLLGGSDKSSKQQAQPFSSFMSGRGPMDYSAYGASSLSDLKSDNDESEPAEVAPMYDWTAQILGIKVDEVDRRIKEEKGNDA